MRKIKIGIVGCGFMGQAVHIPCFLNNDGCEVAALVDVNKEMAKQVARKFQIPASYTSLEELLQNEEIDAVALIVPPQLIPEMAIESMKEGKHVFAEKPIALKSADGREMVKVAEEQKAILMGAYMKRYDLGSQYVKERIEGFLKGGELGKITYARFHNFNGAWRGQLEPRSIIIDEKRKEYEELGDLRIPDFIKPEDRKRFFGTFINFSHDINLMRYFLGDPQKVLFSSQKEGPDIYQSYTTSVFDYGEFKVTLETGAIESDYFDEEAVIYFEKGWVKVKYPQVLLKDVPATVSIYNNAKGLECANLGYGWNFQREVDCFIECIINNKKSLSDGVDSVKDISVAEAWYQSYLKHGEVDIQY